MLTKQSQKIRIIVESFNHELLTESCNKIIETINDKEIDSTIIGPIYLPTNKRIYCVLRSPHVDKDSREHFEIRVHKRILEISYEPEVNLVQFLFDVNLPAGVLYQAKVLN
jgi:small subunit ribosomal protein S10|tara:strand:+ start:372 stop:704 length:333 start_codon:yes stop_codon:yes gene_type:complete